MGPARIGHLDIMAYRANYGISLEPWEVRTLLHLDALWMSAQNGARPAKPDAPPRQKPPGRKA